MSPTPRQLGIRLRKLRQAQGLTKVEVAAAAGVTPQYIAKLEAGRNDATVGLLQCLASALGVRVEKLLESNVEETGREVGIEAVRVYLEAELPEHRVKGPHSVARTQSHEFLVDGRPLYALVVHDDFLEDHTPAFIGRFLEAQRVVERFREGQRRLRAVKEQGAWMVKEIEKEM
jgi:transcriptional regulator with XRE-family HTH domain